MPQYRKLTCCGMPYLLCHIILGLFWLSGIAVACVCLSVCPTVSPRLNPDLVRALTCDPFKPWSPNLDQKCKTPCLGSLLFLRLIDFDFKAKCNQKLKLIIFGVYPHDHSTPISARISRFEPTMHFSTVKIPIDVGLCWPCFAIYFFILKPILAPAWDIKNWVIFVV